MAKGCGTPPLLLCLCIYNVTANTCIYKQCDKYIYIQTCSTIVLVQWCIWIDSEVKNDDAIRYFQRNSCNCMTVQYHTACIASMRIVNSYISPRYMLSSFKMITQSAKTFCFKFERQRHVKIYIQLSRHYATTQMSLLNVSSILSATANLLAYFSQVK